MKEKDQRKKEEEEDEKKRNKHNKIKRGEKLMTSPKNSCEKAIRKGDVGTRHGRAKVVTRM